MKKLLKIAAILVLILIIAVPILIGKLLGPAAQAVLTDIISPALGVKVEAEDIDISVLGGSCKIKAFEVGNPEGYTTEHAFHFDSMTVDMDLWSLLGDVIHVQEVSIDGGEVIFESKLKGSNLTTLMNNAMKIAENPTAALSGDTQTEEKSSGDSKITNPFKKSSSDNSESSSESETSESSSSSSSSADAGSSGTSSSSGASTTSSTSSSKPIKVKIDLFVMSNCGVKVATALTLNKAVSVPMGEVKMDNIGGTDGVAPTVALAKIMAEVTKASTKAAFQKSGDMLKGAATQTGETVKDAASNTGDAVKEGASKATEGLKSLFGK